MGRSESVTKRPRAKKMLEMKLMGVSNGEVAKTFGVSTRYVTEMQTWGKQQGLIEEISAQLTQESLPKLVKTFNAILDTDIADATLNSKGYSIKAKVASDIAKGLGVFKSHKAAEMKVSGTMDLDQYRKLRQLREDNAPKVLTESIEEGEVIE